MISYMQLQMGIHFNFIGLTFSCKSTINPWISAALVAYKICGRGLIAGIQLYQHLQELGRSCRTICTSLMHVNKFVLPDNVIKLITAGIIIVMSHLNYFLPVWGPSLTKQNICRIQCLQNCTVRLLYHLNKYDPHITSYYNRLRWLKFEISYFLCQLASYVSIFSFFQRDPA